MELRNKRSGMEENFKVEYDMFEETWFELRKAFMEKYNCNSLEADRVKNYVRMTTLKLLLGDNLKVDMNDIATAVWEFMDVVKKDAEKSERDEFFNEVLEETVIGMYGDLELESIENWIDALTGSKGQTWN